MATATGKLWKVNVSKTRDEAITTTATEPNVLFFPTDNDSIIFNGKEYWTMTASEASKLSNLPANAYSKGEVDKHLALKANSADVYTKAQTDTAINNKVSTVYKPKGSKAHFSDLTTADQVIGDVWNIQTPFTLDGDSYPAGTNVVWIGEDALYPAHWDPLSGAVDLTPYAEIANLPSKILSGNGTVDNSSSTEVVLRMERTDPATGDTVDSDYVIGQASSEFAGVMSASDKTKLNNVPLNVQNDLDTIKRYLSDYVSRLEILEDALTIK